MEGASNDEEGLRTAWAIAAAAPPNETATASANTGRF